MPIQIFGDYECKYGGNSHRDANTPVTCGICGIRPQPPTLHWRDNNNVTIFFRTLGFYLSLSLGFASRKFLRLIMIPKFSWSIWHLGLERGFLWYNSTFVPDSRPHCWKISEFSFFVTMLFNRDKMAQVFYSLLSLTPRQLPTMHLMRKLPNIGFQRNFSYWNKWIPSLSTSSEEGILPPQLFVSTPFMKYIKVLKKIHICKNIQGNLYLQ